MCARTEKSKQCSDLKVDVLDPSPRDLQLTPNADLLDQPTCLPSGYQIQDDFQQFSVFREVVFTLEATVATGNDLTFTFDLLDSTLGYRCVSRPNQTDCSDDDCLKASCVSTRIVIVLCLLFSVCLSVCLSV